jgi:hypothetical protein
VAIITKNDLDPLGLDEDEVADRLVENAPELRARHRNH